MTSLMRSEVICREDWNSLFAVLEGIVISNPPWRAGRAKRSPSRSLGGCLPVMAKSRRYLNTVSIGVTRWPMLEVTWLRYVHLLYSPCVSAEKGTRGHDFVISPRKVILDDHDWTLAFMHFANSCMGANGCTKVSSAFGENVDPWASKGPAGFLIVSVLGHQPHLEGLAK